MRTNKRMKKLARSLQAAEARKAVRRFTRKMGTPMRVVSLVTVFAAIVLVGAAGWEVHADNAAAAAASVKKPAQAALQPSVSTVVTSAKVPEPAAKAALAQSSPVTITGCVERDDQTFRLKNTSGTEVPKSRSWKSGFLKKHSTSIELVDGTNRAKLPSHVGERVTVTGTLINREMQVRSLQRVASSCDGNL